MLAQLDVADNGGVHACRCGGWGPGRCHSLARDVAARVKDARRWWSTTAPVMEGLDEGARTASRLTPAW